MYACFVKVIPLFQNSLPQGDSSKLRPILGKRYAKHAQWNSIYRISLEFEQPQGKGEGLAAWSLTMKIYEEWI